MTGGKISYVEPNSPAAQAGIKVDDELLTINNRPLRDVIDYQIACLDNSLKLSLKSGQKIREIDVAIDEPLGIKFYNSTFDGIKRCANSCRFCFIDQLPPNLRSSLYIKDDDFRLSFLYGNFITLTNISFKTIERIIRQHLSPLYISIHSTDAIIRRQLMGFAGKDNSLTYLKQLVESGIEVHIQIVLCPGVNDGAALEKTLLDLAAMDVASIGIVPVGLSAFRDNLPKMEPVTKDFAKDLIERISSFQQDNLVKNSSRLVFLADEFYLLAAVELPADTSYEGYPQLENGIGLARRFLKEAEEKLDEMEKPKVKIVTWTILTSRLASLALRPALVMINARWQLELKLLIAENSFFGGGVSVAGLLTGSDIIAATKKRSGFDDGLLAPDVCVNSDGLLLDGLTAAKLEKDLPLRFMPSTGRRFIEELAKVIVDA